MADHLHHVHIFASDIDASVRFYREHFGGKVVMDNELNGVRNVFMAIGAGRLCLFALPPRSTERGAVHHFAIQTDDIESSVERMKNRGIEFRRDITDLGHMKFVMVPAPDNVLIEYFEVKKGMLSEDYADFFE